MEAFRRLEAVALPVAQANVDTDQIVPARFLQKPRTDDFGQYLFCDLRFDKAGTARPEFLLNRAAYRQAKIVVAERNFGCGSSREHAVWALYDYGFRAAIAPSFGDIFRSNALKNGFLPIVLDEAAVTRIIAELLARPGARIAIDLEAQTLAAPDGSLLEFDVPPFAKHCLLRGLDEIDFTLSQIEAIRAFERDYDGAAP